MYKTFLLTRWEAKRDLQWEELKKWLDKYYPIS